MKTIPSIIAATLLLASVSATAGSSFEQTRSETLITSVAPTKAAAYQLGANKLAELKSDSSQQLEMALATPLGSIESDTLHLNEGGFVTIQERMNADGEIGYVGLVNVDFSFVEHDSDH